MIFGNSIPLLTPHPHYQIFPIAYRPLFGGENDFQIVLKEAFPDLRTRKLTRRQWGMIRRMMGKPRRCSQVYIQYIYTTRLP